MKSTVKELSPCKREIEVEIDPGEVMGEFERILTQYSQKAKIPGFRPGKAPKDIVKRMFYPDIKDSLINYLAPKALNEELQSQNLNPIGSPVVNELHFKEGEPFRLKAQFEIWPEISLPEYRNIKVKKKKISMTEKEINQSLEELRLKSAQYVPVEGRGVIDGDYVIAEVKGRDTKTKRFFPTEKVIIIAGAPDNETQLNQKILGLKPNEEAHFVLSHSKEHPNNKLAGKEIEYDMKVVSIKERRIPEINDDFAKDLGEYEHLKDLKAEIKESLLSAKEKESKNEMAEKILKDISDRVSFELPDTLVEQETVAVLRRMLSSQPQKEPKKEDLEKSKEKARTKAKENLKNHLILRKIAEKEKIDISDVELREEMKAIAQANTIPLDKVIDTINKEGRREELRNTVLFKKTVDFLVECAIIE